MLKLLKQKKKLKKIKFKGIIGSFNIFFIEKEINILNDIIIKIKQKKYIKFEGPLGILLLNYKYNDINFFKKKNKLIFSVFTLKTKKKILNLYYKLILIKIKGITQGYKLKLILKGIGFKSFIEKNNLKLKIGFSHDINIKIPDNIKIIQQSNNLIFSSIDYILLTQFVHFVKNHKKPEPYKGKGLLLKDEKILIKEGKKSKK